MDLDTFVTVLYCLIDDWYKANVNMVESRGLGRPQQMSDAEILTIVIAGQWRVGVPWQSERGLVRYLMNHGLKWFPTMLRHSQFNRRARQVWQALVLFQQDMGQMLCSDAVIRSGRLYTRAALQSGASHQP